MNGETITAVVVSPAEATIKAGTRIKLKVEGKTAAGSLKELTDGVEWRLDVAGKAPTIDVASIAADGTFSAGSQPLAVHAVAKVGELEDSATVTVVPMDPPSTCAAAALYKQDVDPIVQGACISCHAQGKVGAGAMTVSGPSPTDEIGRAHV